MTFRFLDIDLDAFVDPIAYWPEGGRLDEEDFTAWAEPRLRQFLETQCRLSTTSPIPGDFVIQHDGAFDILDQVHAQHGPIDVTHVDAHADLGMGDPSWVYMHKQLLQLPMNKRASPRRGDDGMNLGSWLTFAVAAGWVSAVTFVHPEEGAKDLPPIYFRNADIDTRVLELKRYAQTDLGVGTPDYWKLTRATPVQLDPPVAFDTVLLDQFSTPAAFDRGLVCHSPDYTPRSADLLIPILREYIVF